MKPYKLGGGPAPAAPAPERPAMPPAQVTRKADAEGEQWAYEAHEMESATPDRNALPAVNPADNGPKPMRLK